MKNILRNVWIALGVVLIAAVVFTCVHANMVISDIHAVSDSVTIEDVRQGLNIIEKALDLELLEQGK